MTMRGIQRGQVLRADPDGDREEDPPVTSGAPSPQPVNRPSIMSQAALNESERKKIQAKQTKWNVAIRASQTFRVDVGAVAGPRRSCHQRSEARARP